MRKAHDPLRSTPLEKLTPLEARLEWQSLAEEIAVHDVHYHRDDAPIISDANRMLSSGITFSSRSIPGW
mgnify:CR=1 FL=1